MQARLAAFLVVIVAVGTMACPQECAKTEDCDRGEACVSGKCRFTGEGTSGGPNGTGTGDGGMVQNSPDGGVGSFSVQLQADPTAIALSETGATLYVATMPVMGGLTEIASFNASTGVQGGNTNLQGTSATPCVVDQFANRGTTFFVACVNGFEGSARAYRQTDGNSIGLAPVVTPPTTIIDNNQFIGIFSVQGQLPGGGALWSMPSATPTALDVPSFARDNPSVGAGLIENATPSTEGIVVADTANMRTGLVSYRYLDMNFQMQVQNGSIPFIQDTISLVLSGRRHGASTENPRQALVLFGANGATANVFEALPSIDQTNLSPAPVKTFEGVNFANTQVPRAKFSRDGRYVLYFAPMNQLCRLDTSTAMGAATMPACTTLDQTCTPVDFAVTPTGAAYVACTGSRRVTGVSF